jgi:hypothetical protein
MKITAGFKGTLHLRGWLESTPEGRRPQIRGFRGEGGVGSIEASGCSRKRSRREFSVRAYYRSLIALGNTDHSCPDLKLNKVRTPEYLGII